MSSWIVPFAAAAALLLAYLLWRASRLFALLRARPVSLAGYADLARRWAACIPYYEFDATSFFCADRAPAAVTERRRAGFKRLADDLRARSAASAALYRSVGMTLPDSQLTARYRVPFAFSRYVLEQVPAALLVERAGGVELIDVDGNRYYDLTGSYGVNLFGIDFYRRCIERGAARVAELGPVLGPLHPLVADNVRRLCALSGLDAVSFHMSGTEAVMQAVRLARFHTRRPKLVRFSGAYHGWWDDVQPGVGNPIGARHTLTLAELSDRSLRVLRHRDDIACVLVNPLQAMHPNRTPPGDNTLTAERESVPCERAAYARWLRNLREVCSARGIVLIFDEVFVGFRLARGGAQEYYGVEADLVTYGKSVGGGLPVGVLCGRAPLMRRFRDARPADICLARGTFNSHPYVLGAMAEFLDFIDSSAAAAIYADLDRRWSDRAVELNARLAQADLPIRVANLSSIWTVNYLLPSRYNWLLQFYLRDAGIALGWTGTGRLIFPVNYADDAFAEFSRRFCAAAQALRNDGWWWLPDGATPSRVRRQILAELLQAARGQRTAQSSHSPRST
ncbi:MAG: aminotransferase class III-fold pyridoxal phosphate-dependent enzyme [Steroidobacteraceae bacterium]|nr:aminotransferase class III-fold pyridoxal phosphate-dependent enzyme [Steroidobacteraceae bacterium]MDW8259395.1 aminotransferase class III-fold pyridoxal phosphate-dependent enzyme [Gammaproteobacteria bacterium]